ncbi:MAG: hypothetical protein KU29_12840 [Sulfurovum sp. FS06-10]|nr:MAG: hypothetical protein KU29_12840 [Sulfurovum sp. FS06-10]
MISAVFSTFSPTRKAVVESSLESDAFSWLAFLAMSIVCSTLAIKSLNLEEVSVSSSLFFSNHSAPPPKKRGMNFASTTV